MNAGRGSILASHVDRLPLVISAIINVDQRVKEDWPLEIIDHSGKAVNVTMQPGEMVRDQDFVGTQNAVFLIQFHCFLAGPL